MYNEFYHKSALNCLFLKAVTLFEQRVNRLKYNQMSSEEPQKRDSTLRVKAIMPKPISFYHSHPVKPIYFYLTSPQLIGETKGLSNFVSKIFAKINTQSLIFNQIKKKHNHRRLTT